MSEERSTRDRLLDAFESLLVTEGSRAATLEAVASHAGVSKGGLLYHFGSKDELVTGMLTRLVEQAAADTERMRTAPEGPVRYHLDTSVDNGSDYDRALIATARIAQESHEEASLTLARIRADWLAVLDEHLGDHALAVTIQTLGDGLYFNDITSQSGSPALPLVHEVLNRLNL